MDPIPEPRVPRIDLLTVEEKLKGCVEPDLDSFVVQNLDEVWMGVEKQFIITAFPKISLKASPASRYLGGRWAGRVAYNIEGANVTPLEIKRTGNDTAFFNYTFQLQGIFKIWLDVSSIPVKGSPFTVHVKWGSTSQISKWMNICSYLKKEYSAVRDVSLAASIKLFDDAVSSRRWAAVDYRRHILENLGIRRKGSPEDEVGKKVDRCILVEKVGNLLDDFSDFEALLVSHNSWLEWPKTSGYQAKLLDRLSEKEKKVLLEKSANFGKSKLSYGSTMIFPVSNLASPGKGINSKQLINTVTVVFKTKQKITENVVKNTKYADLERALALSFSEAERKGIKSIVIPNRISQNYYQGKNEEAILNIVKDWVKNHPTTSIHTLVIVSKDQTPKAQRKKKSKK